MKLSREIWIRAAPVRGSAKAVLWALGSRANRERIAFPSHKTLSLESGCGVSTIKEALMRLESAGAITKIGQRRKGNRLTSNAYRVHFGRTIKPSQ